MRAKWWRFFYAKAKSEADQHFRPTKIDMSEQFRKKITGDESYIWQPG